jgi:hypothetical protein
MTTDRFFAAFLSLRSKNLGRRPIEAHADVQLDLTDVSIV